MRETRDILEFWEKKSIRASRIAPARFVLATLTATEGSTYRKAGAQKLIAADRDSAGLLSGGCLEGEIVDRALDFLELRRVDPSSALTSEHVFDTSNESDRLFGYQKGCRGKITIQFSEVPEFSELRAKNLFAGLDQRRVVIFGCGADAQPLSELLHFMGWSQVLIDHRQDMVSEVHFPFADELIYESAETSWQHVRASDRVVVMTHNFEADMHILKGLASLPAEARPKYLGFLGPRTRFEQLQTDVKNILGTEVSPDFVEQVRSPIGLKINGFHPSELALSIVAEMQMHASKVSEAKC